MFFLQISAGNLFLQRLSFCPLDPQNYALNQQCGVGDSPKVNSKKFVLILGIPKNRKMSPHDLIIHTVDR